MTSTSAVVSPFVHWAVYNISSRDREIPNMTFNVGGACYNNKWPSIWREITSLERSRSTIHNKYYNFLSALIPLFTPIFQRNGPSYIPNHYKPRPEPQMSVIPLWVIITSSFLQRGSQYTPRCHHHPLSIVWLVGGGRKLQEDYYYPSPLGHVIEIQDVWVTSRVYLKIFLVQCALRSIWQNPLLTGFNWWTRQRAVRRRGGRQYFRRIWRSYRPGNK